MEDWMLAVLGLLLGVIAGYLLGRLGGKKQLSDRENELAQIRSDFQQQHEQSRAQFNENLERQRADARETEERLNQSLTEERTQRMELLREKTAFEEQVRELQDKLKHQQAELEKNRQEMEKNFQLLANRIFEEKSTKFTEQNKESLDSILNPLKERIKDFEKKVEDRHIEQTRDRAGLKEQIKQLHDISKSLGEEANQLTVALKGDSKAQGNWGELVLERILEKSGLRKGEEYQIQYSETTAEGKRLQPDVVIQLPDAKHIIVDSKVSLVAYEQLVNADDPEDRKRLTRQHVESVRNHVTSLSRKDYSSLSGLNAPDFVLLFIPIEASFAVAIESDQALFDFAWKHNTVIVTPSTLLATLRTVESVWKHERQIKNATDIAEEAGRMLDKLAGFTEDLEKMGKQLKTVERTHRDAMTKLAGHGGLIPRAEKLKNKGVRARKQFSDTLLNQGSDAVEENGQPADESESSDA